MVRINKLSIHFTKTFVLIILLAVFWGCGRSKSTSPSTGSVTGIVKDNTTRTVVIDTGVAVSDKTTSTGTDGIFTITGLPYGEHTLTVNKSGYTELTKTLTVQGEVANLGEIFLYLYLLARLVLEVL